MKLTTLNFIVATIIIAVLAAPRLVAQESGGKQIRYSVINLGTLGGSLAEANGISNKGWVAGYSTLRGDATFHAFLWTKDDGLQDLGTLGAGPNSSISFPMKDTREVLVGGADTSTLDPYGGAPDHYICRGFRWQNGTMTALPTLGGRDSFGNSYANGVNNKGQVVGISETANPDRNCIAPQVFGILPVIWGPNPGQIEALPMLPGDVAGLANVINDKGQVAGASSPVCAPGGIDLSSTPIHIVLWENGTATNLGSLGG